MSEDEAKPSRQYQAAAWFAAERAGLMFAEQRADFDAWRADPRNEAALSAMRDLWDDMAVLKNKPRPASAPAKRRIALPAAAALLLIVLGGAFATRMIRFDDTAIETIAGQQKTQSTPDGSVIAVNVASNVTYRITDARRLVRLKQGEAAFMVKPDSARPFVVRVGDYEVRATGTAFNVKERGGAIQVAVSEGKVQICRFGKDGAPIELTSLGAGQLLRFPAKYSEAGFAAMPREVAPEQVGEWRMRIVTYEDAPIRDVVEDFNRYFAQKLLVQQPELLDRRVTIRLKVDNREQAIETLADLLDAHVVRTERGEAISESSLGSGGIAEKAKRQ
jgi:transmembrane sensor